MLHAPQGAGDLAEADRLVQELRAGIGRIDERVDDGLRRSLLGETVQREATDGSRKPLPAEFRMRSHRLELSGGVRLVGHARQ